MLYLEDYLELIEQLPSELRDRLIDIRERDLQVHNSGEHLADKVKNFFAEAKRLDPEQRQQEYEKLLRDYEETMKYAEDKVQIAGQTHDIMIKLVQRLDGELEKFKLELEADHVGITEQLERRSLELDAEYRLHHPMNNHHNRSSDHDSSIRSKYLSSAHRDGRRSEHKHQRHPHHNNVNAQHGRAKLSQQEHLPSTNHTLHPHPYHSYRQGSKSKNASINRQLESPSPNQMMSNNFISYSTPLPQPGVINGLESGQMGKNSSLFSNNSGFKNTSYKNTSNNNNASLPFSQQHSALSAALSSTPNIGSNSAMAMVDVASVHNKISNHLQGNDQIDSKSPLAKPNPLTEAATQAIVATQQLHQGRRTSSLKASFAAINSGGLAQLDALNSNRNALAPMAPDQQAFRFNHFDKHNTSSIRTSNPLCMSVTKSGRPTKRPKHHASHLYPDESPPSISSDNSVFENSESLSSTDFIDTVNTFGSTSPSSLDFATSTGPGNTSLYHRDEKKYCICRQVSYGEMVACDNNECEIEWFHYDCVGVTQPPKGKWFCPDCTSKMTGHQQTQAQHHQQSQPQQKKRGRKEKSMFNLVKNPMDVAQ